ncbi:MAG: hypothetical protein ACYTHK_19905 [Planctomycetota bacterium]|jgi:hypothetical protein
MRPWLISLLIVAIAVGGTLYLLPEKKEPAPKDEPAMQVLDRETVESYITIAPQIDRIVMSNPTDPTNKDKVYALLQKHGQSNASWDRIRRRVEDSVLLMRRAQRQEETDAELDRQIAMKEAAYRDSEGKVKESLAQEIAHLKKIREEGTIIHEADRKIMERYWADLDRIAPRMR